jgi:hypothetical protein
MQIIDNFLPDKEFKNIQDTLLNGDFPWFLTEFKIQKNENKNIEVDSLYNFQFTHTLYNQFGPKSNYIDVISPILVKLKPSAIVNIKANITPITPNIITYGYHLDNNLTNSYTSVYYINSNNGSTVFENGSSVNSIENRMVIFNSTLKHSGTSCTDQKVRCVINFNFYKWE